MRALRHLILAELFLCLFVSAQNQPGDKEAQVDKLLAPWSQPDVPGIAVAVVVGGEPALVKGYGCADLEHGDPVTPKTLFNAASLAKQFTAFAVLTLVGQKKLSLDDDVRNYMPEFPDFGRRISLSNLLHHTSGLRDWGGLVQMSGGRMDDVVTTRMIMKLVSRQKELNFPPGTEYAYSNAGYVVLAEVVARASGQTFKDWTRANIFIPFKMEGATFRDDLTERKRGVAFSYERRSDGRFERVLDNEAAPGPGSLLVSAEDMARWLAAFQARTLGGDIWEKMTEPGKLADGRALDYAAGLIIGSYRGLPILHHSGRWAGFRGETVFFPDERVAIAVLTNNFGVDPTMLSRRVAEIYLEVQLGPSQARPAAPVSVKADALDRLVGRYWLMGERIIEITRRENRLFAQLTGDFNWEIFPESDNTFVYRGVDAKIQFGQTGARPAQRLIYWQGLYAMPAERIPAGTWSPATPQEFCGLYYSEELGSALEVRLNEKGLFIPFVRRSDLLLVPMAEDSFAGKDSSTKLRFVRGDNGKIVELRFSMTDARNVKFAKVEKLPR